MMFIKVKGDTTYTWQVGQKMPLYDPECILEIQADREELEYVREMFTGLPTFRERVVKWYGDLARTVFVNLSEYNQGK